MDEKRWREEIIAFRLDERLLRGLDEALAATGQPRSYDAVFAGRMSAKCQGIEELMDAMKRPGKILVRLTAETPFEKRPSARVVINPYSTTETFGYTVWGDGDAPPKIKSALDHWVSEVRANYSWLATWRLMPTLVVLVGCSFIANALTKAVFALIPRFRGSAADLISFFALWGGLLYGTIRYRYLFFPPISVYFAAGERIAKAADDRRKWLYGIVAVSALGTTAAYLKSLVFP